MGLSTQIIVPSLNDYILAFFHGFDIRFHVESATALLWITHPNSVEYTKTLLVKLDSVRRCKERGFNVSEQINRTSRKLAGRVIKIFKNLPKPLEWRSFYINDLPILMDIHKEVQEASI